MDARDELNDSLIMNNPTQYIAGLNLQSYTNLECEPLHDMKGHLSNVVEDILEKEHAAKCKQLLDADLFKKDTKTGADYRIHQLFLLHRLSAPHKVIKLMETAVELLYANDSKDHPKLSSNYIIAPFCIMNYAKKSLFEQPKY